MDDVVSFDGYLMRDVQEVEGVSVLFLAFTLAVPVGNEEDDKFIVVLNELELRPEAFVFLVAIDVVIFLNVVFERSLEEYLTNVAVLFIK